MEQLIESLKNTAIYEPHLALSGSVVLREAASRVHFQKCLIPPQLFSSLNATPGDTVTLLHNKTKYILRVFQNFNNSDAIEVYGIVQYAVEPTENQKGTIMEKLGTTKKFTTVTIDLVCESDHVFTWLSRKTKLQPILERRILRNILFCEGSTVNLQPFPDSNTLGVRKVIILQSNPQGVGSINSRTRIYIRQILSELQYENNNHSSLIHFFGATRIIRELTEMIDFNIEYKKTQCKLLPPIKQVLLAGPTGCGKSSLVQRLCNVKRCPLVKIMGQDIHSKDPGQSEKLLRDIVDEVFLYAKCEGICIFLLEDIEVICPRSENIAPHTARLSSQLLQLLDKCQAAPGVIVIATTNKPADIHAGLRRHGRLAKEIFLSKPSENERSEIILNFLNIFGYYTNNESATISNAIANVTPGYLGADLKLLCQTTCSKLLNSNISDDKVSTTIQIMKEVLLGMKPASLRNDVEVVTGGLDTSLGGLNDVKRQLELSVHCSLLQPHIYTKMGIQKPRGILLYGPPGCAKTSLAKTLASKCNITVLYATNASIYSPYVGDAEKAIVNLFHNARQNTPAVIFIDEIDSLVGSRSGSSNSNDVQERVLAALLIQMDGIGITKEVADSNAECADGDSVMVVAATNRPNEIDSALLRPGRFDRHIFVPPPDIDSRFDILSILSKNTPLDDDVDLHVIARKTEYYSGADLKNLHKETVLFAMQKDGINVAKIKQSHYEEVLQIMKPSLNREIVEHFEKIF